MTEEQPTNFNKEVDRMLTQSEQRIEQLRELNRPIRPWEKERLKERLSKLEHYETWDKAYFQEKLTRLKKEIRIVSVMSVVILCLLLLCCAAFGLVVWKT
ncbi:hypothetical protein [Crocosphaera chwakensis]|uniref:Uncharacterized protein n=1 Tax=Crocosphaera chwakensis CCY0110 TaxID=391612 RepID=A3IU06_9CHRO|nr:hypothetical protein [Crocosphaera chwakensis]EAZ89357.1 hypothetical protein CY0110_30790 [Crocosphaera chwakensis CCY0110]EAZ90101.1 hypothetical protein CY0110_15185 [Crocosphaera chwakensis CCY0110]